jgi:hypothetical protein
MLVNANCCTVAVVKGATAVMTRGAVAAEAQAAAAGNQAVLDSISQVARAAGVLVICEVVTIDA